MTQVEYQGESLPTPEEFRRQLSEAREQYDPVETLLAMQRELIELEAKYGMPSAEAYRRYQAGEAGDDIELVWWVGRYRQYLQLGSTSAPGGSKFGETMPWFK